MDEPKTFGFQHEMLNIYSISSAYFCYLVVEKSTSLAKFLFI